MALRFLFGLAAWSILANGPSRADVESQLLEKFRQQNSDRAEETRRFVGDTLARAEGLRTADPEAAASLLAEALERLRTETTLMRADRDEFQTRCDRLGRELEAERAARAKSAKDTALDGAAAEERTSLPPVEGRLRVGQAAFGPVFGAVPTGAAVQVTPVVSADRRYVRIGVNGFFSIARPGPVAAVPVFVPTVLQGPGRNFTVLPFPTVAQPRFLVGPAFGPAVIGLNTTATAPVGGSVVVGGYSSSSYSSYSFGTPVLGRIPYVAPFFRGVGFGGQASSTRIVIGP